VNLLAARRGGDQRGDARIVLILTSIAAFMGYLDVTIVNVSFPAIHASFANEPTNTVVWVLDIYSIVLAGLLLTAGRMSDVIGHRIMFLCGLTFFTSGSALCAAAPELGILIGARAIQAFGAAIFTPASLAMILVTQEEKRRPAAVATWTSAAALAAAVGPSLGGLLTGDGGTWRWIFVVNIPIGVIVLAATLVYMPRTPPRGSVPSIAVSALLLSAAFLAALGITRGRVWGWTSLLTVTVCSSSVIALVLCVWCNSRSTRRVLDRHFRNRLVVMSNAMTFLVSLAFFAYLLSGVLFMTSVWGYSVLKSGLAMSAAPVSAIPAAIIVGRLARPYARIVAGCGCCLVAAFGYGAAIWLNDSRADLLLWVALGIVVGLGIGMSLPLLSALAVEKMGGARFAAASALNSTVRQFGGVLAFAGVAAVVGGTTPVALGAGTYRPIWLALGTSGLVAACAAGGLPRYVRHADHGAHKDVAGGLAGIETAVEETALERAVRPQSLRRARREPS
jgi:EmrB/QacA subfamily drug resistance transporter